MLSRAAKWLLLRLPHYLIEHLTELQSRFAQLPCLDLSLGRTTCGWVYNNNTIAMVFVQAMKTFGHGRSKDKHSTKLMECGHRLMYMR